MLIMAIRCIKCRIAECRIPDSMAWCHKHAKSIPEKGLVYVSRVHTVRVQGRPSKCVSTVAAAHSFWQSLHVTPWFLPCPVGWQDRGTAVNTLPHRAALYGAWCSELTAINSAGGKPAAAASQLAAPKPHPLSAFIIAAPSTANVPTTSKGTAPPTEPKSCRSPAWTALRMMPSVTSAALPSWRLRGIPPQSAQSPVLLSVTCVTNPCRRVVSRCFYAKMVKWPWLQDECRHV